jgi:hypothetical protein
MLLNFDHNFNLSLVRSFHTRYGKTVKMCQFYSDSSLFFCNQLYPKLNKINHTNIK